MQTDKVIAVTNEKGGTAKTTTAVSLSAALGELGQRVLLVDLDGQAASSRWLGVEEDSRLADAMRGGRGLEPIADVLPGVWLVPASGKLDSVAHDLRPTQGGQLRKVLAQLRPFDAILIDCPPSLGNRLIANALMAAQFVLVPVETSILALDGLKILLTTLEDIREGFGHNITLGGVLACRYDGRTRLSRLVLEELRRALPGKVFETVIRENVRMRECPASRQSIMGFAPDSNAAKDYLALAREILESPRGWFQPVSDADAKADLDRLSVDDLRAHAAASVRASHKGGHARGAEPDDDELAATAAAEEAPVSDEATVVHVPTSAASAEVVDELDALVAVPPPEPDGTPGKLYEIGELAADPLAALPAGSEAAPPPHEPRHEGGIYELSEPQDEQPQAAVDPLYRLAASHEEPPEEPAEPPVPELETETPAAQEPPAPAAAEDADGDGEVSLDELLAKREREFSERQARLAAAAAGAGAATLEAAAPEAGPAFRIDVVAPDGEPSGSDEDEVPVRIRGPADREEPAGHPAGGPATWADRPIEPAPSGAEVPEEPALAGAERDAPAAPADETDEPEAAVDTPAEEAAQQVDNPDLEGDEYAALRAHLRRMDEEGRLPGTANYKGPSRRGSGAGKGSGLLRRLFGG